MLSLYDLSALGQKGVQVENQRLNWKFRSHLSDDEVEQYEAVTDCVFAYIFTLFAVMFLLLPGLGLKLLRHSA